MRHRMTKFAVPYLTALMVGMALTACRDGVQPFTPVIREMPEGDTYQLTYSRERDFAPSWSVNSDTVFYSTARFADYPAMNSTLLRIARPGGIATLLAPGAVASDTFPRLVLPVPSPDRQRVAYIHIPFIRVAASCGEPVNFTCRNNQPLIERGVLRIRDIDATAQVGFDRGVPVDFAGRNPGQGVAPTVYNQQLFPFQKAFVDRGEFLFRPSWSPDGARLVFSDGLMLRTWDPADAVTVPIPNTTDGVSAAWSPAGNVIAFTRLVRDDSTMITCACQDPPGSQVIPTPIHNRWLYTVSRAVITLVDPAGATATELVDGEDPAFSPDGAFVYFAADNRINRIPVGGGAIEPLPGTENGRSPAVSPDGQWLAFTRSSDDFRNNDIWITRLSSQ